MNVSDRVNIIENKIQKTKVDKIFLTDLPPTEINNKKIISVDLKPSTKMNEDNNNTTTEISESTVIVSKHLEIYSNDNEQYIETHNSLLESIESAKRKNNIDFIYNENMTFDNLQNSFNDIINSLSKEKKITTPETPSPIVTKIINPIIKNDLSSPKSQSSIDKNNNMSSPKSTKSNSSHIITENLEIKSITLTDTETINTSDIEAVKSTEDYKTMSLEKHSEEINDNNSIDSSDIVIKKNKNIYTNDELLKMKLPDLKNICDMKNINIYKTINGNQKNKLKSELIRDILNSTSIKETN